MPTSKVKISPAVLKWARTSLHLPEEAVIDHFAQKSKLKFGLSQELLEKIENGNGEEIKFTLLQELSNLYKRPLAIFFIKEPPEESPLPKDRRTLGSDDHTIISPIAVLAIRRARYVQDIFTELSKELEVDINFPLKKFSLSEQPSNLGLKFRELLNFTFDDQRKLRDSRGLFDAIRAQLEGVNVFTVKSSFPLEDARAFSFVDKTPFLILINNKDGGYFGYAPKSFSLVHEFAHILLRESGICNDFSNSHQQIEKFCNSFAASFLVPDEYFWKALDINKDGFEVSNLDNYLNTLKDVFKVSREVLLRKCLSLNLIGNDFYTKKIEEWRDEFEKERKAKEEKGEKQYIPIITPARRAVSNNGRKFVELVLHAKFEGKITVNGAADYLGVNLKSLPEVEGLSSKPRPHA